MYVSGLNYNWYSARNQLKRMYYVAYGLTQFKTGSFMNYFLEN
jgi:hypothetical protein